MDLIIKTSKSALPDNTLKSNLGDLIRTTVLVKSINEFLWLTDPLGKKILRYFIPEKNLITAEQVDRQDFKTIYNLDNYLSSENIGKIRGNWKGFYPDGTASNEFIMQTAPYLAQNSRLSWQQALIEGMDFKWQEQDYSECLNEFKVENDIGLNYNVHKDWSSKTWPIDSWKKLFENLSKKYRVSWQRGLDSFDEYISWLGSCKAIITCDSLGLHLASALRKKVFAIVGPTTSREFSYGRVFNFTPVKECLPCNSPKCSKGIETCLKEISPEDVEEVVKYSFPTS